MIVSSAVDVGQDKAELVLHACLCNEGIFCKMWFHSILTLLSLFKPWWLG